MAINIAGSLRWACSSTLMRRFGGASSELPLFVATGVLGGFTTFSAFSLDFVVLWGRGAVMSAFGYALGSVALSIVALFVDCGSQG
jgi:CrcB protein